MTKIEQIALAIFRSVTSDSAVKWASLSSEEREDALAWARVALREARPIDDDMLRAGESASNGSANSLQVGQIWSAMIDEIIERKGTE